MTLDPLSDVVSSQYEQWVYPEPIVDLPGWLETNWQWFDPWMGFIVFDTHEAEVFAVVTPCRR